MMEQKRGWMMDMAKNAVPRIARAPRAWIYCRMAHSGPDSAGLLAMQRRQLEACAKEHGFEIVGYSSDVGSGLTFNRPGLLDFLDAVYDEAADVLLLSDLTRLGRDMGRADQFWQLLRGRGIGIYTAVNGEIDLSMKVMLQKVIGQ